MEAGCLRHTEFPDTSALFVDFLYRFDRVARFYGESCYDPSSFAAAAERIRFPAGQRAALVSALRRQNGDSPSLELLSRPETVVVGTGQQVGLFSGPAYTLYKALTAIKLARSLTAQGIPSVPVFWLATEDHDFDEVRGCWVFDSSHHPVRLQVDAGDQARGPAGLVEIPAYPVEELQRSLSQFPFGEEVTALVRDSYAPGRTVGAAFGDLLRKLLASYGVLFLDPMQADVRELAAPVLRHAVEAGAGLTRAVLERNTELETAGYHAQVRVEKESSLLFLLEGGRRLPLRRDGDGYVSAAGRYSAKELAERAAQLSPNAVLRPVVQNSILPAVAYVGGPAEVAYLAQSQVLHNALLGRMPVVLPRAAFTLLDARSGKLLRRYGLSLPDCFHGEEPLRQKIAARLVPPVLERRFEETKSRTGEQIERLRQDLAGFDPTLAAALDASSRKILYQLGKIERKSSREALRRDGRAAADASYLHNLVYPAKHPQERFYSILPFAARHGFDLLGRIYENVRLDCPDHRILVV